MLGDGHSGFRLASTLNYPPGGIPIPIDLNGDGKDRPCISGRSVGLTRNGDGTFGLAHTYSQTFDYDNVCVFADMDGDGHTDAVCGYVEAPNGDIDGATHLIILHGNGDGSFNPIPSSINSSETHDTNTMAWALSSSPSPFADLNGDGVLDVISASVTATRSARRTQSHLRRSKTLRSSSIATPGSLTLPSRT